MILAALVARAICHFRGHLLGRNDYQRDILLRNVPGCMRCGRLMLAEWFEHEMGPVRLAARAASLGIEAK